MVLEPLDIELMESFDSPGIVVEEAVTAVVPAVEPAAEPEGSFRGAIEQREGEALDAEYKSAQDEMVRLISNVARLEEEYFEFPTPVRLAGTSPRIRSLKDQWLSLTDKMGKQRKVLLDIRERRRRTGREVLEHALMEAKET